MAAMVCVLLRKEHSVATGLTWAAVAGFEAPADAASVQQVLVKIDCRIGVPVVERVAAWGVGSGVPLHPPHFPVAAAVAGVMQARCCTFVNEYVQAAVHE
jgi:tetrahydromethanopterin S-methyltransferase subunit C